MRYSGFGETEQQREANLKQASRIATGVNILGGLVGAWTLLFPRPYAYAVMASIIMPIIGLVVIANFSGLIRIGHKKGSAFPSVIYAVLVPGLALLLRALQDFSIFSYSKIWIPMVVIAVGCMIIANWNSKEYSYRSRADLMDMLGSMLFTFAYGYGALVTANCLFDQSEPQVFQARVLDKRTTSGRHSTSYHLDLSPWGQREEADDVTVSKQVFDRAYVGGDVNVYLMEGRFGIPWFEVNTITKITPPLSR